MGKGRNASAVPAKSGTAKRARASKTIRRDDGTTVTYSSSDPGVLDRIADAPPDDVDLDAEVVLDSQGRRITEEYAEAAAADALAQVGRGRRSLTGRAAHSPRVSVRVTDATAKRLDEIAEREGKTRSQVAREALERL